MAGADEIVSRSESWKPVVAGAAFQRARFMAAVSVQVGGKVSFNLLISTCFVARCSFNSCFVRCVIFKAAEVFSSHGASIYSSHEVTVIVPFSRRSR